jgi:hypothetical protein
VDPLRLYPSLLLLYAGGVAALSADNYGMFVTLLTRPRYHDHTGECHLLFECHAPRVFSAEIGLFLPGSRNHRTAPSEYLFQVLRPLIETILPNGYRYADRFDRFEYLMSLVFADLNEKAHHTIDAKDFWGPIGRFVWRQAGRADHIQRVVTNESAALGANWPPLKAGLFGGSVDRFNVVKEGFDRVVAKIRSLPLIDPFRGNYLFSLLLLRAGELLVAISRARGNAGFGASATPRFTYCHSLRMADRDPHLRGDL